MQFEPGDEIYGVTNPQFIGACAEFALASAGMIARKPESLTFIEAASAPVIAVTAWQMLFDYAKASSGKSVLIHGAGGGVGSYAVQLASEAGLHVFATASADDAQYVQSLGADTVIDYRRSRFEEVVPPVDIVLDMVGGDIVQRSFQDRQATWNSSFSGFRAGAKARRFQKHSCGLFLSRSNHGSAG